MSRINVDEIKPDTTNGSLSLKGDSDGSATTNGISVDSSGNTSISGSTSLDGAVTINDSGADVDFRVESDTDTHALFVEGSSGNVGIGTTPSAKLHILNDQGGADGRILFDANVSSGYNTRIDATDIGLEFTAQSNSRGFVFKTGSTPAERMRIDSSGNVELTGGGDLTVNGTTTTSTASLDGAVTINESGADVDFRVESGANTHALFVDAGLDSVAINGATPYKGTSLNVTGIYRNIANSVQYSNAPSNGQQVFIQIDDPGATTTSVWGSTLWSWVTGEVQVYIATSGATYKKTYSGIIYRDYSEVVNIVNEGSVFQITTGTPSAGKFGIGFRDSSVGVGPTYNGSPVKTDFVIYNNTGYSLLSVSVTIKIIGVS